MFSMRLRNNLRFSPNRSHLELSWLYPISRDLRLFVQATHGYADSLIDYNYKQTT
ncbi:phospholipase A, partial [Neisseria gonorrhoeae]